MLLCYNTGKPENIMLSEISQPQKWFELHFYGCLKSSNLQKQKVEQWLSETEGSSGGELWLIGAQFPFCKLNTLRVRELFVCFFLFLPVPLVPQPRIYHQILCYKWTSQVAPVVKNPPANVRDLRNSLSSISGSGRSPAGGHGNPLQYSCLENPMDRGVWPATVQRVTKSQT